MTPSRRRRARASVTASALVLAPLVLVPLGTTLPAAASPTTASPTTAEVVFVQQDLRTGTSSVVLHEIASGAEHVLLGPRATDDDAPELSADGSAVVLETGRLAAAGGLAVVGRSGSGLRALTTAADADHEDVRPSFTPDGRTVVFARQTLDPDDPTVVLDSRLFRVDVEGGAPVELGYSGDAPDVSPDGARVVFTGFDGKLYTAPIVGQALAVGLDVVGRDPEWSPDGTQIAFESVAERDVRPGGRRRRRQRRPPAGSGHGRRGPSRRPALAGRRREPRVRRRHRQRRHGLRRGPRTAPVRGRCWRRRPARSSAAAACRARSLPPAGASAASRFFAGHAGPRLRQPARPAPATGPKGRLAPGSSRPLSAAPRRRRPRPPWSSTSPSSTRPPRRT